MWVYQEPIEKPAAAAALPAPKQDTPPSAPPAREAPVTPPTAPVRSAPTIVPRRRSAALPRDCTALAAAYLFGALLSGVALALCRENEQALLAAYLDNWAGLFRLEGAGSVWGLFGAEYLTAAGGATILLLAGLSAFGPLAIYLFVMLFGLGVGVIGLQLLLGGGWEQALLGLLVSGPPTAAAAACLCLFGASALRVSGQLHRAAFGREGTPAASGARKLLGQYLLLNVAFLPICGASTALVCLAGQLAGG